MKIPLAIVNVADEKEIRERFNIRATPTMIWFENGRKSDVYREKYVSIKRIVYWVINHANLGVKLNVPKLEEFVAETLWAVSRLATLDPVQF